MKKMACGGLIFLLSLSAHGIYAQQDRVARHEMSALKFHEEFDKRVKQGFKPSDLQHIDQTITDLMDKYNIPGLSIAIAKDGRAVFAKGYGYADKEKKEETTISHLFRIASVSKPVTATAIMKLIEDGKLSLRDKVFGRGGVLGTQYGKKPYKARIEKITVQNLLEHTAGWSNDHPDPMGSNPNLNFNHQELISWVLDNRPLDNVPGCNFDYSNFGYCVLGRILKKKSGQTYSAFVKASILKQCGINDMHIAGDTKKERRSNEVIYYAAPGSGDPYEMKVARMDANGGWIASAIDLLRFAVRVDGLPTKPDILSSTTIETMTTPSCADKYYAKGWSNIDGNMRHGGGMPGTRTMLVQSENGFWRAVLTNYGIGTETFSDDFYASTRKVITG